VAQLARNDVPESAASGRVQRSYREDPGVVHTRPQTVWSAGNRDIYCTDAVYLGVLMTKRLIDVDDDVLEAARRVLGTDTIKDTVNSALRASVQAAERRQRVDVAALKRFAEASRDLLDDDVMADAWR
jgi:Arc/MetJ family transcription regulator